MGNVATDSRNKFLIGVRKSAKTFYEDMREYLKQKKRIQEKECINSFVFYPIVTNKKALSDIVNRASWYLPAGEDSDFKVVIPVSKNLKTISLADLATPSEQARYIDEKESAIIIKYYRDIKCSNFEKILLWNWKKMFSIDILPNIDRVSIVDPRFYSWHESFEYSRFYHQTLNKQQRKQLKELSINNFKALTDSVKHYDTAWTFATGPSIEKAFDFDYSHSLNIICNSIVKNKELLKHINPHALFCADPVFHFGPSQYSHEFRRFMIETVKEFNCYILIPYLQMGLYLANYPYLKDRIIGIEIRDEIKFPSYGNPCFSSFNNILPPMLELASFIAKDVYIIGADGRNPKENYFWRHNDTTQLTDLMETVFNTHPSFFRDRVYTDYYEEHCNNLEKLILYGERRGIRYHSATKSYIPVLKKRKIRKER